MRTFMPLAASLAALALLAACGGGSDDPANGNAGGGTNGGGNNNGGGNVSVTCNTSHHQAGAVEQPSAAQMSAYAGTFAGQEGSFGPNPGDPFVKSADATFVLGANGSVSYKGTAYTALSICIEKASGGLGKIMYVEAGNGHFDVSDQDNPPDLGRAWGVSPVDGQTLFRNSAKQ